ncbi:hypothetical protein M9H77_14901 [Catharanthus roseus]|uniref:Uncharacterized protein n=1 Tax=Catharanthus roseus TaxID=4058 RepID=A0ACC0BPL2_CATRO|nr:hypothetical protein M9H77_14901 [Catharanthus roseus]
MVNPTWMVEHPQELPNVKTKTTVVKDPMTSKSNVIFGLNKLEANTTTSKENMEKSSSSEHAASNLINEPAQQLCSLCKSNTATTTVDATTKRKSGRRKSFTSLLVSKSKEELPNIYDDHNHLEVSEYVDDIYQYYWVMEAQKHPSKDYTETQSEMTPQMRGILINWLIEVHTKFDLMQETLFLMVTLLDQYLSLVSIKKSEMQLVGLTALLLASKYEDFWHPKIMDLISVSAEPYTRTQMLQMESAFLRTLNFRLNAPTSFVFMLRLLKAAQSGKKVHNFFFFWSGAERNCAEMILKFQKGAKTGLLKVTCEKYMKVEFNKVAAIAPLEMLP